MSVRLMTPGPTAVLEDARLAMAAPIIHHRTEEFRAIVRECREGLKAFFRTADDVVILSSSGTGGMEAAFVNLLSPGDRVLVGTTGKFGDRWLEIARAYGIEAQAIRADLGYSLDPETIAAALAASRPRALLMTASETSVGVKNDVSAIMEVVRRTSPETLVAVDAITALGAFPFETGGWGVDAVIGSSQKALSLPPGLAFVGLSSRAREATRSARLARFYFDLPREFEKQASGDIGFTPAISLVIGLRASLRWFLDRSLERVWSETARRSAAVRAGLGALGIELVPRTTVSESVTAAWVPKGMDGVKLLKDLESASGIKIAGGQGDLKGKIFRIAHFGPLTDADTLDCLDGIETLLRKDGRSVAPRSAAGAAERAMAAPA